MLTKLGMPNIIRAKCVIAGDSTVGKTALTQVFHSDGTHFPKNYTMTCGIDLSVKTVNIPDTNDSVELYINDSPGKDLFTDVIKQYWVQPSLLCLVYDVTNDETLPSCRKWCDLARSLNASGSMPTVLLGNKIDLKERRVVSPKAGQELAKSLGVLYFECSAKDNVGVEEPFFYLANEWHKLYLDKTSSFKTVT